MVDPWIREDQLRQIIERIVQQQYDEFWEPVKVTTKISDIPVIDVDNYECSICLEEKIKIIKLPCCTSTMCTGCSKSWFEHENIHCPYCRKDIRSFIP